MERRGRAMINAPQRPLPTVACSILAGRSGAGLRPSRVVNFCPWRALICSAPTAGRPPPSWLRGRRRGRVAFGGGRRGVMTSFSSAGLPVSAVDHCGDHLRRVAHPRGPRPLGVKAPGNCALDPRRLRSTASSRSSARPSWSIARSSSASAAGLAAWLRRWGRTDSSCALPAIDALGRAASGPPRSGRWWSVLAPPSPVGLSGIVAAFVPTDPSPMGSEILVLSFLSSR